MVSSPRIEAITSLESETRAALETPWISFPGADRFNKSSDSYTDVKLDLVKQMDDLYYNPTLALPGARKVRQAIDPRKSQYMPKEEIDGRDIDKRVKMAAGGVKLSNTWSIPITIFILGGILWGAWWLINKQ